MAIRPIVKLGDPVLAQPSRPVAEFVAAALWNLPPVPQLIEKGHEARNRAVIFRPAKTTAVRDLDNGFQLRRITAGEAMITIEIVWGPAFKPGSSEPCGSWQPTHANCSPETGNFPGPGYSSANSASSAWCSSMPS